MGFDWADKCVHVPFGMVSLEDRTMSTRKGKVVFLLDVLTKAIEKTKEVIAEKNVAEEDIDQTAKDVGIGAVMFQELSNNRIKDYVFSWDKVSQFRRRDRPLRSVYARKSMQRAQENAGASAEAVLNGTAKPDMKYITGEAAYELVKAIAYHSLR